MPAKMVERVEESMGAQYPSLYPQLTPLANRLVGVDLISYSNEPSIAGCAVNLYFRDWDPTENFGERHLGAWSDQAETLVKIIAVKPWPYVTENNLAPTPDENNWGELQRLAERLRCLSAGKPYPEHYAKLWELFPPLAENPVQQNLAA